MREPRVNIKSISQLGLVKIKIDEDLVQTVLASSNATHGEKLSNNKTVNYTINGVPIEQIMNVSLVPGLNVTDAM